MRNDFKNMIEAEGYKIAEIVEEDESSIKFYDSTFCTDTDFKVAISIFNETNGGHINIYNKGGDLEHTIQIAGTFI